jgi:N6-L-threonylcarbamoyladenine synthase
LCAGGGVAANRALAAALESVGRSIGVDVVVPSIEMCTDNAAMFAQSVELYRVGRFAPLDIDAIAGLMRRGR